MTDAEQLAAFVDRAAYEDLPGPAREALKIRALDALGCAIGALGADPMTKVRAHIDELGGAPRSSLIGGGRTAPDRAALYNGALVRYLDFNDSYLAVGETCHPSDNLAPVLAACEDAGRDGRQFLTALAVSYQVQCRLSDEAPVRAKGFDHTTQGSYAVAAGVAKALGLDPPRIAHALAISGAALNALRVTRTGALSNWKGLAFPNTAFAATHAAYLAARGVTGPLEVFEGAKGFMESIAGRFSIDWSKEGLDRVCRTVVKRYDAEVHAQSAVEGVLELQRSAGFAAREVERVELDVFDVAYHIIGGGEEGEKQLVRTKEEADHSLPYIVAVALLDGEVMPQQYRPDRIGRRDVQDLLRKVTVRPEPALSRRFPAQLPCRITVHLSDGRTLRWEQADFEGFHTRPISWTAALRKFQQLAERRVDASLQRAISATVGDLEQIPVAQLAALLAKV
ncbi:MAG: MmgE/PrpD family protein [Myxococcales bacterium]|nr:MmgE/PrpD family protein [Myxococcales bacterium]